MAEVEKTRRGPRLRYWLVASGVVLLVAVGLVALIGRPHPHHPSAPAGPAGVSLGKHVLRTPIDKAQQTDLEFPERSHWLQPWRAYLDTFPASRMRDAMGINFDVPPQQAEPTARLLAASGVKRARVEFGWGEVSPSDPRRLRDPAAFRMKIGALVRHGIRPLMLLNANQHAPGPIQSFQATLRAPAAAGARSVQLDRKTAARVKPGRTGLSDQNRAASVIFTSVGRDGTARVSRPLPFALRAGSYSAATLPYEPFQQPKRADGSPNPAFEATMRGWLDYVDAVTAATKRVVGSDDFDVEVWNELSFGSDFLNAGTYYSPAPKGQGNTDDEILRRTVAWLRDAKHGVSHVRIGDGFASQTPFAARSNIPAGVTAMDKHPYPRVRVFPEATPDGRTANQPPVNARGEPDGKDEGGRWRDSFTPRYRTFFPEYYLSAIQAENLVRDLSPIQSSVNDVAHGRNVSRAGGRPLPMWITELNLDPTGGDPTNPTGGKAGPAVGASGQSDAVRAKGVLRSLSAFVGKGATAIDFYAAHDPSFALVSSGFYSAIAGGRYPGTAAGGLQLQATHRFLDAFRGPADPGKPRALRLEAIGENHDDRQFSGAGIAAHPPLYNRDVFGFFPFQVDSHTFVVPTYVMTRDLSRPLAPERYRLQIGGVRGKQARVTATDPLTGRGSEARIVGRSSNQIVVELEATDSPRLLRITD